MTAKAFFVTTKDYAHPLNVVGEHITVLASGGVTGGYEIFLQEGPEGSGPIPHTHPWDESLGSLPASAAGFRRRASTACSRPIRRLRRRPGRVWRAPARAARPGAGCRSSTACAWEITREARPGNHAVQVGRSAHLQPRPRRVLLRFAANDQTGGMSGEHELTTASVVRSSQATPARRRGRLCTGVKPAGSHLSNPNSRVQADGATSSGYGLRATTRRLCARLCGQAGEGLQQGDGRRFCGGTGHGQDQAEKQEVLHWL